MAAGLTSEDNWSEIDGMASRPTTYKLPFESRLFEEALDWPPQRGPDTFTTAELLAWTRSPNVVSHLRRWKEAVVDRQEVRAVIMPCIRLSYQECGETISQLVGMCYDRRTREAPVQTDGFEVAASIAAALVVDGDVQGSPFLGRLGSETVGWCFEVSVRLLITVFNDLVHQANGHFKQLLGGPRVRPIRDQDLLEWRPIIDNTPVSQDSEKFGTHGYRNLGIDFSWLELDAREKAEQEGSKLKDVRGAKYRRNKAALERADECWPTCSEEDTTMLWSRVKMD